MNTLSVKVTEDIYYIGVNDRETHLFENMWPLDNGVTYNSYLIKDEKSVLMDTVKINKVDLFIEKMEEALGGTHLDYLVIHHMEPDHSSSIRTILGLYPDVKIVGNKKTKEMHPAFLNLNQDGEVHLFLLYFILSYNAQWKSSAYFAKIWIQLWPH